MTNNNIPNLEILSLLQTGLIEKANNLLNYYYYLEGKVLHGNKQGRKIGFPTLNLKFITKKPFILKIGLTQIKNQNYFGLTCVLQAKTTNDILCENWLQDFSQNVYGQNVKIYFLRFYRKNVIFSSLKQIQNLIKNDVKELKKKPKINKKMLK